MGSLRHQLNITLEKSSSTWISESEAQGQSQEITTLQVQDMKLQSSQSPGESRKRRVPMKITRSDLKGRKNAQGWDHNSQREISFLREGLFHCVPAAEKSREMKTARGC